MEGGRIQPLGMGVADDAAVDVDEDMAGEVAAAAVAACLGFAGTLPIRAALLLQKNLVSVYNSRNTKTPLLGGAFHLQKTLSNLRCKRAIANPNATVHVHVDTPLNKQNLTNAS